MSYGALYGLALSISGRIAACAVRSSSRESSSSLVSATVTSNKTPPEIRRECHFKLAQG